MSASPRPAALRPLTAEDRDRLFDWRNRDEVRRFMYTDMVIPRERHDAWFDGLSDNETRRYFIIEWDDEPVGLANFVDIDRVSQKAAWAFYLAEPAARGKGLGAWVEFRMIEHAFDELKLEKLWCEVLESNAAVWKLHLSFGFQKEAHFRRHVVKSDGPHDVIGLGLLREDWAAAREACRDRLLTHGYEV
ncbi:UDP-4-amino-4,6-dideoxy-N-acetyl-beta-L-altrosamine N-acetyltransferase [Asticcacaulis sp. AND118]|uniref:UDP-4-amino-4, 6-dideoxy-N-acetyl-beta-L-altrosamine N-acetyltransferase n=1 Tax=Asticcacaulis sp. AND118 TaxID=2840468 RepID=UPI001D000F90|nr:UDP-4-amino-4,6-dideoxy-N-acetyl-beta-L-altrosamine N-acetyltransferase [Asticcacaulis sp. AND118]UDF03307.1 UDP-4-amino-4,6-dideoxy-N-acetyl-beta-L-altrosamine N-acetyltransferase [Asticcacaulis sp. AND118]